MYIALGSNLGDRLENLRAARQALPPAVRVLACSLIYITPPWGILDQPEFLNQAIRVETRLGPQELLQHLKAIEGRLGRKPTRRNGPRLIDLDILLYDDLVLNTPTLTLPHPGLSERAFVLVPLADLAPELLHPVSHLPVRQLLEAVDRTHIQPYIPNLP